VSVQRLERVVPLLQSRDLGGLVLMPDANLRYFSGLSFHAGKRLTLAIIPSDGSTPALVLPALEAGRAEAATQMPLRCFAWSDADGPQAALDEAIEATLTPELRSRPLAIEATAMRVMELRALEMALPGLETVAAEAMLAQLRMAKDAAELATIETAVQMVETALQQTIDRIGAGLTERELSRILSDAIIAAGAEGESFENIVASGPNAANPHHANSDRPLAPGDLIIIDCGARYRGYISDITRTIALGEPAPEARRIYELVQAANAAGRAAARPGATGAQIDAAARAVIEAGGYGPAFLHRTGHGFGLETHELPNIVVGSDEPLVPGTTFTVEPGIYLPGKFGVRIEDDMVITAEGARSLTSLSRDLLIVPA
jgi:Xaa-Pro dipeptidase